MRHHTIRELQRVAKAGQLQYAMPRIIVEDWFAKRDIPLQSEIWIYPNYPYSWDAVVGAWDRVWILNFSLIFGTLVVKDIQHMQGFRPNGTLIFS